MAVGIIVGAGIGLFVLITFSYYNRFVRLSHRIDNSLSQIDVQLKKRADLVPNLVKTVKGFAKQEKKIMSAVSEARKAMISAKGIEKKMKAGNALQQALGSIFAIAENYPDLKSDKNFLHLQTELSAIEDKVAYARQYYNDSIMAYNVMTTMMPAVLFARLFGFGKKDYIKIPAAQKVVPKVDFDTLAN